MNNAAARGICTQCLGAVFPPSPPSSMQKTRARKNRVQVHATRPRGSFVSCGRRYCGRAPLLLHLEPEQAAQILFSSSRLSSVRLIDRFPHENQLYAVRTFFPSLLSVGKLLFMLPPDDESRHLMTIIVVAAATNKSNYHPLEFQPTATNRFQRDNNRQRAHDKVRGPANLSSSGRSFPLARLLDRKVGVPRLNFSPMRIEQFSAVVVVSSGRHQRKSSEFTWIVISRLEDAIRAIRERGRQVAALPAAARATNQIKCHCRRRRRSTEASGFSAKQWLLYSWPNRRQANLHNNSIQSVGRRRLTHVSSRLV